MKRGLLIWLILCFFSTIYSLDLSSLVSSSNGWKNLTEQLIVNLAANLTECENHISMLMTDTFKKQRWALEMLDASAKMNTGILNGNILHIGSYDQCLNIYVEKSSTVIKGKYCNSIVDVDEAYKLTVTEAFRFLDIKLPNWPVFQKENPFSKMLYGICIPSSCSTKDLTELWNSIESIFKPPIHLTFREEFCDYTGKPLPNTQYDSAIWIFFILYSLVLIFSTFFDYFVQKSQQFKSANILVAFSLYSNAKKLFSEEVKNEEIKCVKGIKVLSAWWILVGHSILLGFFKTPVNAIELMKMRTDISVNIFLNGAVAVDTFFTLSGFLLSYLYLTETSKGVKITIKKLFTDRFLKFTIPITALMMFTIGVLKYLGSGPFWWPSTHLISGNCIKSWWQTIFFIENFVPFYDVCCPQCWYISVDSQLYFISSLLLFPLLRKPKIVMNILLVLSLSCMVYSYYVTIKYNYGAVLFEMLSLEFFDEFYRNAYTRLPTWSVGVCLGYILFKIQNQEINIPKAINIIFWSLSICILTFITTICVLFQLKDYNAHHSALYNALARPLWAIGVSWIIFVCCTDNAERLNNFLSQPLFCVLEKLNYGVFLAQITVMTYKSMNKRINSYFSIIGMIYDICGDVLITYGIAIAVTLSFESPVRVLLKNFSQEGSFSKEKVTREKIRKMKNKDT